MSGRGSYKFLKGATHELGILRKRSSAAGDVYAQTVETWRARVPGGWIILTVMPTNDGTANGTTFYPDPQHEWEVVAQ